MTNIDLRLKFLCFKDNFSTIIEWKHLKMWLIHRGLSQLTFLFVSPGDREGTVVIETCQCEYALAAIIEIVKELQVGIFLGVFFKQTRNYLRIHYLRNSTMPIFFLLFFTDVKSM